MTEPDPHENPNWPAVAMAVVFWAAVVVMCLICALWWGPR